MGSSVPYVAEEAAYDELINGDLPVLVDFTADWCGPCKSLAPVLEELSVELDGKVKIVKVDVDKAQAIAGRYGIRSIPTMKLFQQGKVLTDMVGASRAKQEMRATIESALA